MVKSIGAGTFALAGLALALPTSCFGQAAGSPFYIRLDAAVASYDVGDLAQKELGDLGGRFEDGDADWGAVTGIGLGVQLGRYLRLDATGEYRHAADVSARDHLSLALTAPDGVLDASTRYSGDVSAIVGLANLYLEIPLPSGITPYIGAGIGAARVRLHDFGALTHATFTDAATGSVTSQTTRGEVGDNETTNLAWALMAGASIDLTQSALLDIGYRYLDLGSSSATGLIRCDCGSVGSPLEIGDLTSHEFRVGLRLQFPPAGAPN